MTILTSERFAEICYALWGEHWKAKASARLERSRRQLLNVENGDSNVTPRLRRALLAVLDEQIAVLQAFRREYPL